MALRPPMNARGLVCPRLNPYAVGSGALAKGGQVGLPCKVSPWESSQVAGCCPRDGVHMRLQDVADTSFILFQRWP